VTWFLPEERDFKFKDQLQSELSVAFGGRVAEEIIFNRISTGAANDIKQATNLAQTMVRNWGMSEKLGPLSYAKGEEQVFLGREIAQHRDYSEATARMIDEEINKLIKDAYQHSEKVLRENLDILHKLAELLLEKETVLGSELDEMIKELRPGIKLPSENLDEMNPKRRPPQLPNRPDWDDRTQSIPAFMVQPHPGARSADLHHGDRKCNPGLLLGRREVLRYRRRHRPG
jgi:cell division protease FtsH